MRTDRHAGEHLTRQENTGTAMASLMDRGDTYRVEYLGCSMLSQMATGLGVLQKPLRQLYFQHCHMGDKSKLQERHLVITSNGMTMSQKTGSSSGGTEDTQYPMPCILYWDAVRFVTVGASTKKMRGAFEPLDNDHSRNKDNLFQALDKKLAFLRQMSHPALFACVLRRTVGLKALDVHAFVCESERCAMGLVRALNAAQNRHTSHETRETGVFEYSPFAPPASTSRYTPAMQAPAVAIPTRTTSVRTCPPPGQNRSPRRRRIASDTDRQQVVSGHSRVYQLSQDHFLSADPIPQANNMDDHTYQCLILNTSQSDSGGISPARQRTTSPEVERTKRNEEQHSKPVSRPTQFAHISPTTYANSLREAQSAMASPSGSVVSRREHRLSRQEKGALAALSRFGSAPVVYPNSAARSPCSVGSMNNLSPIHDVPSRKPSGESQAPTRPIAMVQPHKVQGIKVLPNAPSIPRMKSTHDRTIASVRPSSGIFTSGDNSHLPGLMPRRTQSQCFKTDHSPQSTGLKSHRLIASPIREEDSQVTSGKKSHISSEKHFLLTQKKDAEIAGLVKNMRLNYEQAAISPDGRPTNFEKSLGYFP